MDLPFAFFISAKMDCNVESAVDLFKYLEDLKEGFKSDKCKFKAINLAPKC